MYAFLRRNSLLLLKYSTAGSTGFGVDVTIFTLLVHITAIHYIPATVIGFFIGSSVHFLLARRYVFRGTAVPALSSYARFLGIALVSIVAISTLMHVAIRYIGLPVVLSRLLIGVSIGFAAFLLHKHVSFLYIGRHTP